MDRFIVVFRFSKEESRELIQRFLTENSISVHLGDCIWQWFREKYKECQRRDPDGCR